MKEQTYYTVKGTLGSMEILSGKKHIGKRHSVVVLKQADNNAVSFTICFQCKRIYQNGVGLVEDWRS